MTRRVIDSLDGPVVLVGHSYGGAVITEAGTHEKRELRQERKIPYPQASATKERRKQRPSRTPLPTATWKPCGRLSRVFVAGQAGYDQARQAWNLAVDQRPSVVVEAESAADVAQAVRYARARAMRIAQQRTGHGAAPLEPLDDAMLLRTTRMRQGGH